MLKNLILIVLSFLLGSLIGWCAHDAMENHIFHNHNFETSQWHENF